MAGDLASIHQKSLHGRQAASKLTPIHDLRLHTSGVKE
jgi:hypothetical protein